MQQHAKQIAIALGISAAIIAGLLITKDARCLWGLVAMVLIFDGKW